MGRPRKEGYETLGVRLHESAITDLKMEAVRRKIPVSELVLEACTKAGLIRPTVTTASGTGLRKVAKK